MNVSGGNLRPSGRDGKAAFFVRQATVPAQPISAADAAGLVKSGMWLDYGTGLVQPDAFDAELGARIGELSDIKLRSCLTMKPRAVIEADTDGSRSHSFSLHFSGYDRRMHDAGRASYLPVNLGEIPDYYRRFIEPVDVVVMKTCPIDADGYYNLSASNLWHRAIIERAKTVIVETSQALPYAYGHENGFHASEVDYVIEGDNAPAPELANASPTEADRAVARFIAAEVDDGSCLQIGIGGMPNAVCSLLLEAGVKDLGVHTEMMTDGIAALYRAGRVTGARKNIDQGKAVYSFALGSKELYATLDRNEDMSCCPVEHTNLPSMIMQNDRVVSINSTTQVDLQGQAASESDGLRHISGTGGQLQFVRGAYASKGGKSFICLPSTYDKRGERRSRIVLRLTHGNIVTVPRTDIMYVATEYGIANLKGKTVAERAIALIAIAHPDFREELERQAYEHRLIPRGFSFSK
jgi:acyl-CoA hydrolase